MAAYSALLTLYGLAVGVSLGLTGGGGSIITVPLLVYLVGEPVHTAIATSLVIVGGIALYAFASRRREADTFGGLIVGFVGLFGAVPGRLAAQFFSGGTLLLLFALIMLVASVFMFHSKTYETKAQAKRNWIGAVAIGIAVGFLTGFLGVGGGFLIVPSLVLALGMPIRSAIPTSLLVIAINCASSLLGSAFMGHGGRAVSTVDWNVAIIFVIGGIVGSLIGAGVAARLNQRALKRVFAVFVFAVGLFVVGSVTGLIPLSVK